MRTNDELGVNLMAPEPKDQGDDLESAVDTAIAACDGDVRATIRALIVSNSFLHQRVERLTDLVSPGFARGNVGVSRLLTCILISLSPPWFQSCVYVGFTPHEIPSLSHLWSKGLIQHACRSP
jgi:hypothetical protein